MSECPSPPAPSASLEAEVKLALTPERRQALLSRLTALGATCAPERAQTDLYLAHPVRDFAATDEALRIRRDGDQLCMTYKGPKLDPPNKTREEIEIALAGDFERAVRFYERLGFRPVAKVAKRRTDYGIDGATVSLDDVDGLGTFCEIEVAAADVASAHAALAAMRTRLGLDDLPPEPRSYLELLLERNERGR